MTLESAVIVTPHPQDRRTPRAAMKGCQLRQISPPFLSFVHFASFNSGRACVYKIIPRSVISAVVARDKSRAADFITRHCEYVYVHTRLLPAFDVPGLADVISSYPLSIDCPLLCLQVL
jgi:hypothetical protein